MSTQENGALLADDETKLREALAAGPTPGPWRWEFNASSKDVSLVGGRIRYDVTVMDFTRWGMGGAVPRFVEPTDIPNGLQLLHKLSDRKDWIAPFPDREHHADWCAQVTHPDARWMQEAAPDRITRLLDELQRLRAENERLRSDAQRYRWLREHFAWHRGAAPDDEDEARAFASVPFPYRTDLSCAAMLDYAIDKAAAQGGPASTADAPR